MKLDCIHGYFLLRETKPGQVSSYMSLTGLKFVAKDDYYTFEKLLDAPVYSIKGSPYLLTPAIKTFEGKPWEVFEENAIVYDFSTGLLRPIMTVTQMTKVQLAGNLLSSPGLILPGSITDDGKRVKGYSAWYSRSRMRWVYTAVYYV